MWPGLIFVGIALLIFIFKIYVSYDTKGGTIGMVPTLDGAIFPPPLATLGLFMWGFAKRVGAGNWIYFAVWLISTAFAFWAIYYAGKLGERSNRKDS
jgi:hypothetical protein